MATRRVDLGVWAVAIVVALLSFGARVGFDERVSMPGDRSWICSDPDSLYHMRRVQRLFEEGLPVATEDPYLVYPEGTTVIWPVGYTMVLWALLAPLAPHDPAELKAWIEHGSASLPVVWGVLTSLVAAAAAWALAGRVAGALAGGYHALAFAAVDYSCLGVGDHHAFASMLTAAMLTLLTLAVRRGVLESGRGAWTWGAGLGVLAALLLSAWVAAIPVIAAVELALGWLVVVHARRSWPGVAPFALAYHLVALVVLLPLVMTSPWADRYPWSIFYLTWVQPALLGAGALVFVPLLLLRHPHPVVRRYHWLVLGGAALVLAVMVVGDIGPVRDRGLSIALSVVGRSHDAFTTSIQESRPLLGFGSRPGDLSLALGYGAVLAPLAWIAALWALFARGRVELVAWVAAAAPLGFLAAQQWRFADGFSATLSVLLGWGAARLWTRLRGAGAEGGRDAAPSWPATLATAVLLSLAAHAGTTRQVLARTLGPETDVGDVELRRRGGRLIYDWLRHNTPSPPDYSVLANWSRGHGLVWAAERPTVADNFGNDIEVPVRFYVSEDGAEAEALLERRRTRYVFVSGQLLPKLPVLLPSLGAETRDRYVRATPGGALGLTPAWYRTVGSALIPGPRPAGVPEAMDVDFLRLVHVSPVRTLGAPYGWIYEHVPGATLRAGAEPDAELVVTVEVSYPSRPRPLVFTARARADADGVARVRIPYCTDGANGDGVATGPLRWNLGERAGERHLSAADVLEGREIVLP